MSTPGGLYAPTSGGAASFAPANAYGNGGYPMQPAGSYDAATGQVYDRSGELIYNWNTGKSIDSSVTEPTGPSGTALQSDMTDSAGSYQRSRMLHTYVASAAGQPPNSFPQTDAEQESLAGPIETGPLDIASSPLRPEIPRQVLDDRMSGTFLVAEIDARSRAASEAVRRQGIGGIRAVRGNY
jgi:hypothetical protein